MVGSIPKVFISYSWTSEIRVLALAERLVSHGVDVVLDKYDLKEGQDKYVFMEQCVTNDEIDRVLIICDKTYTEKANKRMGGVGDETVIISSEVYGKAKQEKFIPIIFEKDENGNPFCPAYVKTRIYIDLSTDDETYESEYEKLIRNIYEKPIYKKPALGEKPEWLENDNVNLSIAQDLIKQLRGCRSGDKIKAESLIKRFKTTYVKNLLEYKTSNSTLDDVLPQIDELKSIRNLYLNFLEALISQEQEPSEFISDFLEYIYNSIFEIDTYSKYDIEKFKFFLLEIFICTTTFLLHYELFSDLHNILAHTYFLRSYWGNSQLVACNYTKFRFYCEVIEDSCKPKSPEPRLYTLTGKILCERERKPIYTKNSLAMADVFLYQIFPALDLKTQGDPYWFPTCYIYADPSLPQWIKLKSKQYCKKVFPLFGVNTVEALKEAIVKSTNCTDSKQMRYNSCFSSAPTILDYIQLNEIGTLN